MEHIAIVGAGVTGAYTAYLLAQAGHKVSLVDPMTTGLRASHVNPGGLNPLHGPGIPGTMETFFMHAFELHLAHWQDIQQRSGQSFNGRRIHRYFFAFTDDEKNTLLTHKALYDKHPGFEATWLETDALKTRVPLASDRLAGALDTYGNATVSPVRYNQAIIAAAKSHGTTLIKAHVTAIDARQQRLALDNNQTLAWDKLVLCCGADNQLAAQAGIALPVKPLKGDLLVARLPGLQLDHDITWGLTGVYQYDDDLYWLGGTRSDAGFDRTLNTQSQQQILSNIETIMPGLEIDVIEHHAAFRPATPDGRPIIDRQGNIVIATGGGSKGMLLSAGIAHQACLLLSGKPAGNYPDLSLQRFNQGDA